MKFIIWKIDYQLMTRTLESRMWNVDSFSKYQWVKVQTVQVRNKSWWQLGQEGWKCLEWLNTFENSILISQSCSQDNVINELFYVRIISQQIWQPEHGYLLMPQIFLSQQMGVGVGVLVATINQVCGSFYLSNTTTGDVWIIPSFRIWGYVLHVEHFSCVFMNCGQHQWVISPLFSISL